MVLDNERGIVSKRHDYGEDCMSCRLVSGGGIIGMGLFLLNTARHQSKPFNRNFGYCMSIGEPKMKHQQFTDKRNNFEN